MIYGFLFPSYTHAQEYLPVEFSTTGLTIVVPPAASGWTNATYVDYPQHAVCAIFPGIIPEEQSRPAYPTNFTNM